MSESTAIFFDWYSPLRSSYYEFEISTSTAFTSTVLHKFMSDSQYSYTGFSNGTYYWRVRGYNQFDSAGTWSETWEFTVASPPAVSGIPITPIYAYTDQQIEYTSTSYKFSSGQTPAVTIPASTLVNGDKYLVLYGCSFGSDGTAAELFCCSGNNGEFSHSYDVGHTFGTPSGLRGNTDVGFYVHTARTTGDLMYAYRCMSTGSKIYLDAMSIIAIPLRSLLLNVDYWYTQHNVNWQDTPEVSTTSTSWSNVRTLSMSIGQADDFLVIASMEGKPGASGNLDGTGMRMVIDGTSTGFEMFEEAGNTASKIDHFFYCDKVTLTAGTHTFTLQGSSYKGAASKKFFRSRIFVVRASCLNSVVGYTASSQTLSTTTYSANGWTSSVTTAYTPSQNQSILIIGNGLALKDSKGWATFRLNNLSTSTPLCDSFGKGFNYDSTTASTDAYAYGVISTEVVQTARTYYYSIQQTAEDLLPAQNVTSPNLRTNKNKLFIIGLSYYSGTAVMGSPVLFSPPSGSSLSSTNISFDWGVLLGANHYQLQVSDSPAFSSNVVDDSTITADLYLTTQQLTTNTYYWRVRGYPDQSNLYPGAWSQTWTVNLTVPLSLPGPITLLEPIDESGITSTTISFAWNPDGTATSYQLQVSTDISFNSTSYDGSNLVGSSTGVSSLSATVGYYHWRVRGYNSTQPGPWSSIRDFQYNTASTLAVPKLNSPLGSTFTASPINLEWSGVTGAYNYCVQVDDDAGFGTPNIDITGTSTSYTISNIANGTWYWRVKAITNAGNSGSFSSSTFITNISSSPSTPTLISPAEATTFTGSNSVTFDWSDATNAATYQQQISTSITFTTTYIDVSNLSQSQNLVSSISNNTYYWRVRGINSIGTTGPWSNTSSFTINYATSPSVVHPRLYLNTDRIRQLRYKAGYDDNGNVTGTPHIHWTNWANSGLNTGSSKSATTYAWGWALGYLITNKQIYYDKCLSVLSGTLDGTRFGYAKPLPNGSQGISSGPAAYNYLTMRDFARDLSLCYDWLYDLLTPTMKNDIIRYLCSMLMVVWDQAGNPPALHNIATNDYWSILDPNNNFFAAHMLGTAYVACALSGDIPTSFLDINYNSPVTLAFYFNGSNSSQGYYEGSNSISDLLRAKLNYAKQSWNIRVSGGSWCEGANYGRSSLDHLLEMWEVIQDGGFSTLVDEDLYNSFYDTGLFKLYECLPANSVNKLGARWVNGDGPQDPRQLISESDRRLMLFYCRLYSGTAGGSYAQYWVNNVYTSMTQGIFKPNTSSYQGYDMLLPDSTFSSTDYQTALDTRWVNTGIDAVISRDKWTNDAVCVYMQTTDMFQGHQHKNIFDLQIARGPMTSTPSDVWQLPCSQAFCLTTGGYGDYELENPHFNFNYNGLDIRNHMSRYNDQFVGASGFSQVKSGYSPTGSLVKWEFGSKYTLAKFEAHDAFYYNPDATHTFGHYYYNKPPYYSGLKMTNFISRDVVHIFSGGVDNYVVVFDRVRLSGGTTHAPVKTYWHFPYGTSSSDPYVAPTYLGSGITRNTFKTGRTYWNQILPLTGDATTTTIDEQTESAEWRGVARLSVCAITQTESQRFLNVIQVTSSGATGTPVVYLSAANPASCMIGCHIKNQSIHHILMWSNYTISGDSYTSGTFSYRFAIDGTFHKHYLMDLIPNRSYGISYTSTGSTGEVWITPAGGGYTSSSAGTIILNNPTSLGIGLLGDLSAIGSIYEPADNWWNLVVSAAPLDSASTTIVNTIASYEQTGGRLQADFGGTWNGHPMGIPYIVVDNSTSMTGISITSSGTGECDYGYPGDGGTAANPLWPIPPTATGSTYVENGELYVPLASRDGDGHLLIYHKDKHAVYETSYTEYPGRWKARWSAVFKTDENYRRNPPGGTASTSTDAAGMSVLAGLIRYDEIFGPNEINHSLRFSVKENYYFVWPASHDNGRPFSTTAPPMGLRIRLKQSVNISSYSAPMQKFLRALKKYGAILADRGGNMYFQGTLDGRWVVDWPDKGNEFHTLHITDFEVIQRGWTG